MKNRRSFLTALSKSIVVNLFVLPIVFLVSYGSPSCGANAGQVVSTMGSDWIACAKADVGGVVAQAVNAVEAIAGLNAATLEADALALIGSLGFDAVDCAVKVVEEEIAAATQLATGSGSAVAASAERMRLIGMAPAIKRLRAVVESERPKYAGSGAHK